MDEQNINGLATPTAVVTNPVDRSFDISTGAFAQAVATPPLNAIKAEQLAKATEQKEIALHGEPTVEEVLYGNTQTNDGFVRQLGSATQTLLADTADSITTGGAYLLKGLDNLAGGKGNIYSDQDFDIATGFFDQFSGKNADETWGYDRTNLDAQQEDVLTAVDDGRYWDATVNGFTAAPGTIVDSIPVVLSMFLTVGVKSVQLAARAAQQMAKASGMGAKGVKAAVQAAKKTAEKQLAIQHKLVNIASKNVGLINFANIQTNKQVEELTKNGGEVTAIDATRIWATNIFLNALEKMVFKDIIKFKNAPVSKQLWGKLDKSSKFSVVKQVVKSIGVGAQNMGREGLQEYIQTWGEIVNSTWGAKDTENFLDVFNKDKNLEALTALFLGAGAGGTLGVPSQLNSLRQGINKQGKLNTLYNNPKKNIDAGHANESDQIAQIKSLDINYNEAKDTFNKLTNIEEAVKGVNQSNNNSFNKVTKVQEALHNQSQATDSNTNQLVTQFGNKETQQILKMIASNETLTNSIDEATLNDIISSHGSSAFQKVGVFLAANSENLTPEIKEVYNTATTNLQEQADTIVNSGGTEVNYQRVKSQLNQAGSISKSTSNYAKTKKAPINGKPTASSIGQNKDSKSAGVVKKLLGLAKPSEAEVELRAYDNATLNEVIKEAHKTISKASQKQKTILSAPNISKTARLRAQLSKLPEHTKAQQLITIAKKIKADRKKIKQTYSPEKTLKETITEFAKDNLKKLKEATDRLKDEKVKYNTDPKDKVRTSSEDKQTIKTAQKMVSNVRKDLDNIDKADIPIIEEAINILVASGKFGKVFADKLIKDIKEKFDSSNIENIDVKEVRKAFINTGKTILSRTKTTTRADIKEALSKLINTNMTLKERVFLAKLFGKAVSIGNLTKEEIKPYLDKLPDNLKFNKSDFTREKFTSLIMETYNTAINIVDVVKSNSTPEVIQETAKAIKNKVDETVSTVKDSGLVKELIKDSNTILANLIAAKEKGNIELTKQFRKFKKDYGETSSLEVYQSIKEIFNGLVQGKDTTSVTSIPKTEINLNKDC